jgi:hypothetical protein
VYDVLLEINDRGIIIPLPVVACDKESARGVVPPLEYKSGSIGTAESIDCAVEEPSVPSSSRSVMMLTIHG